VSVPGAQRTYGDDGFVVRDNGEWAKRKLEFLEQFGPVALKATRSKRSRVYVDLFAGPGINQPQPLQPPQAPQAPFAGSPLRALSLRSSSGETFTDAYFINKNPLDHTALDARISAAIEGGHSHVSRESAHVWLGDANERVTEILDTVHPKSYVFVFADPANPSQLPWRTIELLKSHRAHKSVDLYTLFPYGMALSRMASYNADATEVNAPALNAFYGDESWRSCMTLRASGAFSREFARCMLDVYLAKLRSQWEYAGVACEVRIGNRDLYKMLFATSAVAGRKIAQWATKKLVASPAQISLL
jgi:three-Cys-motif partner protein